MWADQWNIERGYKLPEIIAELTSINADIIAIQEVDIGCERSGNADTGGSCIIVPSYHFGGIICRNGKTAICCIWEQSCHNSALTSGGVENPVSDVWIPQWLEDPCS